MPLVSAGVWFDSLHEAPHRPRLRRRPADPVDPLWWPADALVAVLLPAWRNVPQKPPRRPGRWWPCPDTVWPDCVNVLAVEGQLPWQAASTERPPRAPRRAAPHNAQSQVEQAGATGFRIDQPWDVPPVPPARRAPRPARTGQALDQAHNHPLGDAPSWPLWDATSLPVRPRPRPRLPEDSRGLLPAGVDQMLVGWDAQAPAPRRPLRTARPPADFAPGPDAIVVSFRTAWWSQGQQAFPRRLARPASGNTLPELVQPTVLWCFPETPVPARRRPAPLPLGHLSEPAWKPAVPLFALGPYYVVAGEIQFGGAVAGDVLPG